METVQLIVECTMNEEQEKLINSIGKIKYKLPMINSYVIETAEENAARLCGIGGIKHVYQNAFITAQMNVARKVVKAECADKYGLTGRGIGIAILDTGIGMADDFIKPRNRIAAFKDMTAGRDKPYDNNGHGTHVAGISAGNGFSSNGKYMGIAPEAYLIGVKILDEKGLGNSAEVLAGLQWMMDNRDTYNIRVCNLSIGTADMGQKDPLVRAVDAAWDAGIVVVIAAGNNGPGNKSVTSPGISRKVITVGASDDSNIKWFVYPKKNTTSIFSPSQ